MDERRMIGVRAGERRSPMEMLETSLRSRVDEVLAAHKSREFLSTTGLEARVDELVLRTRGLEKALIELASEVERLVPPEER
jgi:hypothetical protein